MVRVVVADDHRLFRSGIIQLLNTFEGVTVVGEAGTGTEAVALARSQRPDVMLLELDLPDTTTVGTCGEAITKAVRAESPETAVVVVTMHDQPDLVRSLIRAGASAYLIKSIGREELHAAIVAAARADDTVTLNVSRDTAAALSAGTSPPLSPLSVRERELLAILATGLTNKEIARRLHLADATVKRHLATIYAKLECHTRLHAVQKAQALGLID
ncbi:MAG: response regulator transcription factor [Nocardioidaceae bacterium]|nr:response regulator transcription factor [Nocardioidaceae bacterium]